MRARIAAAIACACACACACGGAKGATPATTPPATTTAQVSVQSGPTRPSPIVVIARADVAGGAPADQAAAAEAIAKLETFVVEHPDHPQLTPDALLRLGALQLDVADGAIDGGDEAGAQRATAEAVRALTALIDRFPAYPRKDDALYLLGWARAQVGDDGGAIAAYEAAAAIAASPRAIEARFRAGELAFAGGDLDRAIAAYRAVSLSGDDRLDVIATYKLAWSYYRRDDFQAASDAFGQVLAAGDHDATAADLRPEAELYLALCLVERDWDGDGADDPPPAGAKGTATLARIAQVLGDGSYEPARVAAERAADALRDEARYPEAAAAYRLVLASTTDAAARARIEANLLDVAARARTP